MARTISLTTLLAKVYKTFDFTGIWRAVFGKPEVNGLWLIYGDEKHGKTWFALLLAEMLSYFTKVLYVSAEEGTGKTFQEACQRAQLDSKNRKLQYLDYVPFSEIDEKVNKRRGYKVVFIDNVTVYQDELKHGVVLRLMREYPNILFVFIAHEKDNEPYTATAKMIKRYAKIIIRVEGLAAFVSGRCPGGKLIIDEAKAELYHGTQITQTQ